MEVVRGGQRVQRQRSRYLLQCHKLAQWHHWTIVRKSYIPRYRCDSFVYYKSVKTVCVGTARGFVLHLQNEKNLNCDCLGNRPIMVLKTVQHFVYSQLWVIYTWWLLHNDRNSIETTLKNVCYHRLSEWMMIFADSTWASPSERRKGFFEFSKWQSCRTSSIASFSFYGRRRHENNDWPLVANAKTVIQYLGMQWRSTPEVACIVKHSRRRRERQKKYLLPV